MKFPLQTLTAAVLYAFAPGLGVAAEDPAASGSVQIRFSDTAAKQKSFARIDVTLAAGGASVVDTSNTLTAPNALLNSSNCVGNDRIGKSMLISFVERTESTTTIRVRLMPNENDDPIPDGDLYHCSLYVRPTTPVGTYSIGIGGLRALDPQGKELPVSGRDATVVVEPGDIVPGDLDGDGAIGAYDLEVLLGLLYSEDAAGSADVNGDSRVDSADVVALVRTIGMQPPPLD